MRANEVQISILMSVYNPEESELSNAVQSICDQSFTDWELLLYNDGSDKQYESCFTHVTAIDPRIRYIEGKKNHGLWYGLNRCIEYANGRYLARMDGDDEALPERLQEQYLFLETHPDYSWVGSNILLFADNRVWGERDYPIQPEAKDYLEFLPYAHPTVMFRREAFDQCGRYRNRMRSEDYELFMRLQAYGMQGYNIQKPLLKYREDPNGERKRTYKEYIEESRVRRDGFRKLQISGAKAVPYIIKPLVSGLLPEHLWKQMKQKKNAKLEYEKADLERLN